MISIDNRKIKKKYKKIFSLNCLINFLILFDRDIDGFIGRKAHMNFLTSRQLWEMMSGYFQEIFE